MKKINRIKNILKVNFQVILMFKRIMIINIVIWVLISLVPILSGWLLSKVLELIGLHNNLFMYVSFFILFLGIINFMLIKIAGYTELRVHFAISQLFRKNLIMEIIENKKIIVNDETFLDILINDGDNLSDIISLECDILCRVIFYVIALIIMNSINAFITWTVFIMVILSSGIIFIFEKQIKFKHKEYRENGINYTIELGNYIKNKVNIDFIDQQGFYQSHLKKLLYDKHTTSFSHLFLVKILDKFSKYLYDIITIVILLLSYNQFKNNLLTISQIMIFLSYFSYGCTFFGLFSELFQKYKYYTNILTTLSNLFFTNNTSLQSILLNRLINKKEGYLEEINFKQFQLKKNDDQSELKLIDFKINKEDKVLIYGDKEKIAEFIDIILGYSRLYYGTVETLDSNYRIINNYIINYSGETNFFTSDKIQENFKTYNNYTKNILKELKIQDISNRNIGKNGSNISEGQKQRISIARNLNNKEGLHIFDNCFSLIDNETLKTVYSVIEKYCDGFIFVSDEILNNINFNLIIYIDNEQLIVNRKDIV